MYRGVRGVVGAPVKDSGSKVPKGSRARFTSVRSEPAPFVCSLVHSFTHFVTDGFEAAATTSSSTSRGLTTPDFHPLSGLDVCFK